MATVGSLASAAIGHIQHGETLNARADALSQKQASFNAGTTPRNVTAQSLTSENRNLSHAQFSHRLGVANTTSEAAQSAVSNNGSPSIGDPAWSSPTAIGPGLYS